MSVIKTITGMFWAVSIVLATLPLLGYGRYVYEVSSAGARVSMVTTGWQGYLYTSTVDLLATDPGSLAFCWLVFSVCFILPNTIILPSYISIIFLYR